VSRERWRASPQFAQVLARAAIDKLGIREWISAVSSAEDQDYGKPHPAVYLAAARMLDAATARCLAFEDSINGVISAKAARIRVVAVPYPAWRDDPRFVLADEVLVSLEQVTPEWLERWRAYQHLRNAP
jgi:sugar-phosphatase